MENVFIISDYSTWLNSLIEKLGFNEKQVIPFETDLDEDWKIDHWVKTKIPDNIETILIPIELGTNNVMSLEGLKIALHLRLLGKIYPKRYLPVIFISNREVWQINQMCRDSRDKNHYDYLIGTKGTDFLRPIPEDILPVITNLLPLSEEEYFVDFYEHIKILPNEYMGKHSIANIWGIHRLAMITGHGKLFDKNKKVNELISDLYFKYLTAYRGETFSNAIKELFIESSGKNILLIDDEENKGWSDLLKVLFKDSNFEFVPSGKNFLQDAEKKVLEINSSGLPIWDLILLDLRLVADEDAGENAYKNACDYSGAKLLNVIKCNNKGTQVIIFTASNKAWNMRELIDLGADGYYVKESPEYHQDLSFSLNSFKKFYDQVNYCYKKAFLKKIFAQLDPIINICQDELNKKPVKYGLSISRSLVEKYYDQFIIFKKLLVDFPFELKFSFSTLIIIIEEIIKEIYCQEGDEQIVQIDMLSKHKCNYLKNGNRFLALTPVQSGKGYTADEFKLVTHEEFNKYSKQDKDMPFNYRLTCVLHFRYNLPLDSTIFNFFEIYNLRSTAVFHSGSKLVNMEDLCLMLKLLRILIR